MTRITVLVLVTLVLTGCGGDAREPVDPVETFHFEAATGASPKAEVAVRRTLEDAAAREDLAALKIDYPLEASVFPPDMVAPTFLWHDDSEGVNAWLIDLRFDDGNSHVYVVTAGRRPQIEIDPRCVTKTNVYRETPYQASAKAWRPDAETWEMVKRHSVGGDVVVTVHGLTGTHGAAGTRTVLSRGTVRLTVSEDPVGAPIFYRDVPLMPSKTEMGIIKPLAKGALPLIQWRLRDVSKESAPVVMQHLPTCANCHSFSRDGATLAMDMDGPGGDKGAHAVKTVSKHMRIELNDVFTWNRYRPAGERRVSYGLFPQISPDGRYVVATVHEDVYVQNYMQYEFLQTFYPTRGILAVYDRTTGTITSLPGADDERYVQTNPAWSPNGRTIVFARAPARPAYAPGPPAERANDPRETQIQYDLYRISFNDGQGGTPEPVKGASANGMSNTFAKFSPDGKWIVFVQCRNALLMRPDSQLTIIPAGGGRARRMRCNTSRMNSWHSWSPNSRWLVFSSKANTPYTQMFLTHVDENGNDTPAVLVPNSTAANRAVNLPEFAGIPPDGLVEIATPAVDYRRWLDRGRELEEAGKPAEAEAAFRNSLALREDYYDTHVALAAVLDRQNKYHGVERHLRRAVQLNPSDYRAYSNLGMVVASSGRYEDAVALYHKALRINPRHAQGRLNLGNALYRLQRYAEAERHLRRALLVKAEFAKAHNSLAALLARTGRAAEGVVHAREAVRIDPTYANGWFNLGITLVMLEKPDEAVGAYRKALALAREQKHDRLAAQTERLIEGLERKER